MITAKIKLENVSNMNASMTLTMPLSDWQRLVTQIAPDEAIGDYPAWRVKSLIQELVHKATKSFEETDDAS